MCRSSICKGIYYLDTDNYDFSWRYASDDTNVTYFNWATGEPTGENCVTMGGIGEEFWNDVSCLNEFKFTCEILGSQGPHCDTCKNGFFGALSSCQGKFKGLYLLELLYRYRYSFHRM